jgi:hypothetical protein
MKNTLLFLPILLMFTLLNQAVGATYTVTSAGDDNNPADSVTTLREALAQANANPGMDRIEFSDNLPGGTIGTNIGYSITDDVEIEGTAEKPPNLRLEDSSPLFRVDSDVSASFSHLKLESDEELVGTAIESCGVTELSGVSLNHFNKGVAACGKHSHLAIDESVFSDVIHAIHIDQDEPQQESSTVTMAGSTLLSSGIRVVGLGSRVSLTISESTLSFSRNNSTLDLWGSFDFLLEKSSILDAHTVFLQSAEARYSEGGFGPYEYFYPTVKILNSTISENDSAGHLIRFQNTTAEINHSTLFNNLASGTSDNPKTLISISTTNTEDKDAFKSTLSLSHSVLDTSVAGNHAIRCYSCGITAEYSVLPTPSLEGPESEQDFDATTNLLMDAQPVFGDLVSDDLRPPYLIPQAGSFIINAGNPSAVAGSDSIPQEEQRNSHRILGGVIDIGATEFNRAPELDVPALLEDYEEQVAQLAENDSPDAAVFLDLDMFVSDPDQHAIADIVFSGPPELSFDSDTHIVSGHKDAFKSMEMAVVAEDETGLKGRTAVNWSPDDSSSSGSSSSGGGSVGFSMVGLLLFGLFRQANRRDRLS